MPSAHFSKIVIIQSLVPVDDELTGTKLHDELETLTVCRDISLDVELVNVHHKQDLLEALNKLEQQAKNDASYPLIHFEIHGSDDATGLILSSNAYVGWSELKKPLTNINVACKLNLIIVLSVCYGAHLLNILQPTDQAPFWCLIGPIETVGSELIFKSFKEFYHTLISTGRGIDAFRSLEKEFKKQNCDGKYQFMNAEALFKKVYQRYIKTECTSKRIQHRAKKIYREQKSGIGGRRASVGQIKRDLVKTQENYYYKYLSTFFMHELYEENKNRFSIPYKEMMQ